MDKDSDFLFEAYQKICEAPIGPGSSYDDDPAGKIDPGASEKLSRTQYGKITEEDVYRIIANVKSFLEDHEGSVFPGSMDDLKLEIKIIIGETVEGVNPTKAGYASRVIRNELKRLNIISEVDGNVVVKDVEKVSEIGDEIEDTLGADTDEDKPRQFTLGAQYDVDRDDLPMSASQEAKDAHNALLRAGMAFGNHTGRDIIKATGLLYSQSKSVIAELEDLGVITKAEKGDRDDEDRVVDVGDEDERDYDTAVGNEYEKLRRNIHSGEAPVIRPDDF